MKEVPSHPDDVHFAVVVAPDVTMLPRILNTLTKRNTELRRFDVYDNSTEQTDDQRTETYYMTVRDPKHWQDDLPGFMRRVIGVIDVQQLAEFPDSDLPIASTEHLDR